ncbi:MAG: GTPase Era [Candidatus Gracilibacteria bacterium]|nr:GTPase Era [Candidatus Gracilibacteria bacterium]
MPKVGYVAIIGRPNAGKSTLINALIGEKVSAISHRPQTTQRTIPGIFTDEEKGIQIIFLDTPGIHHHGGEQYGSQKAYEINERINSEAFSSLRDADVIVRLLDPTRPYGDEDIRIDTLLEKIPQPVLRIETKQDMDTKSYPQKGVDLRIDSVARTGFEELTQKIAEMLPEGPFLYDADYYTVQTMDLRISEIIREQLFQELGDEIPYACYVDIEQIENEDPTLMKVQAYINVEADSQKVIVIGKGGKKIQNIGTKSRLILEDIFGKKIFLALRVKVDKNWRKNSKVLERLFPKK